MSLFDSFVSWYSGTPSQAEQDAAQQGADARYAAAQQSQVDLGNLDQATADANIAKQSWKMPAVTDSGF